MQMAVRSRETKPDHQPHQPSWHIPCWQTLDVLPQSSELPPTTQDGIHLRTATSPATFQAHAGVSAAQPPQMRRM
jgi:hypothetical protein